MPETTVQLETVFNYQLTTGNRPKSVVFRPNQRGKLPHNNQYRFDVASGEPKLARKNWVHINHHASKVSDYTSQNDRCVIAGENISIALPIWNLQGQIDMSSLTLQKPQFVNIPRNYRDFMEYDRRNEYNNIEETSGMKILCDVDRICEVEDEVNLWHVIPSEEAALS